MRQLLKLLLITVFFLLLGTTPASATTRTPSAEPSCQPIFGGGEYTCPNQTENTQSPTPENKTNQQTTKGGLTVEKQNTATQTPATGPEAFSLISLASAAGVGFWLRRKTK